MGRKSAYISKINNRDTQSFRLLYFAHHVPRNLLLATDSRLRAYEKQGLVEKCISVNTGETIYKCTDKGRTFIGKLDSFAGHKPYLNANSSEHNILLAQQIHSLPEHLQSQWYSERDVWDMFQARMEELKEADYDRWQEYSQLPVSSCDGGVMLESGIELVEIITDHYGNAEIQEKETVAMVLNADINYFHT